jgi:hypothetical protein
MQRVTHSIQITAALLLLAVVLVGSSAEVFADGMMLAQAPPPVSAPVTNVTSGRSYTVEIGIVVVMFGAALFAICRSSNRT